ncbi:hypothetical protein KFE25_013587 [Diacronema lutheri]|uniref:GMP phosphodiesterase delta subunit domain-containing protein n=1 Tax=Diacronema lutheri TaxID=2081491 RepID=A0A8J6CDE1_DIALT|nr:hypothetical protein KFE25_013587 [Diacronema lutheri]
MPAEDSRFTAADVLRFTAPTEGYLCPLSANRYGIRFNSFKVRDVDSNAALFEVRAPPASDDEQIIVDDLTPEQEVQIRSIRYQFPSTVLSLKRIGTTLEFSIGPEPLNTFRMIERHYFREMLIRSYDFDFGFCIPNSTNTWEAIYDIPTLDPAIQRDMVANPYMAKSDSFYFVNDELVMHNKAEYSYFDEAAAT